MQNINLILKRYSQVLLTAATEADVVDVVVQDMLKLKAMVAQVRVDVTVILNPNLPSKYKILLWTELMKALKTSQLVQSFVRVLIENNRLVGFNNLVDLFVDMVGESKGHTVVSLTVSQEIASADIKKVQKVFEEIFASEVDLKQKIDNSIIGGAKIYFNSMMLDGSIKTKLQKLKRVLLN